MSPLCLFRPLAMEGESRARGGETLRTHVFCVNVLFFILFFVLLYIALTPPENSSWNGAKRTLFAYSYKMIIFGSDQWKLPLWPIVGTVENIFYHGLSHILRRSNSAFWTLFSVPLHTNTPSIGWTPFPVQSAIYFCTYLASHRAAVFRVDFWGVRCSGKPVSGIDGYFRVLYRDSYVCALPCSIGLYAT